jgi:hypothetical protein
MLGEVDCSDLDQRMYLWNRAYTHLVSSACVAGLAVLPFYLTSSTDLHHNRRILSRISDRLHIHFVDARHI